MYVLMYLIECVAHSSVYLLFRFMNMRWLVCSMLLVMLLYTSAKMDEAANEWKGVCYELLYD